MLRASIPALVLLFGFGCTTPSVTEDEPGPPSSPELAKAPVQVPEPAAQPPKPEPKPEPELGPRGRGDSCTTDTECGWNDPCAASRCVGVKAPPFAACEESLPYPGTCSCIENQCTLQPKGSTGASEAGCTTDDECAVDVGAGACQLRGETMIGPITQRGPVCTCNPTTTRCEWSFVGPIACESWKDCSWIRQPRLRPVSAKVEPRPVAHEVRACKDGSVDSVCKNSVCEIVAWSC